MAHPTPTDTILHLQDIALAGALLYWYVMMFDSDLRNKFPKVTALLSAVYTHETTANVFKVGSKVRGGPTGMQEEVLLPVEHACWAAVQGHWHIPSRQQQGTRQLHRAWGAYPSVATEPVSHPPWPLVPTSQLCSPCP
jgi:hypothetical protein